MTPQSTAPLSGGAAESHPVETSAEALVASFAEADQHTVDLSGYGVEDWICLGFFWAMAGLVFLQFFSRYVLNDSYAWTEELAVYCLMPVVFIGASMCVRASPGFSTSTRTLRPTWFALNSSARCCNTRIASFQRR